MRELLYSYATSSSQRIRSVTFGSESSCPLLIRPEQGSSVPASSASGVSATDPTGACGLGRVFVLPSL
jgi:hypothetical protein